MFSVECPTHDSTVLLGPGRIVSFHHDATGTTVGWRCTCGTVGTTRIARLGASPAASAPVVAAA